MAAAFAGQVRIVVVLWAVARFAGDVKFDIGTNTQPPPRVTQQSMRSVSSVTSSSTSTAYYPVSAFVDEVALTVTFTEPVGIANVMVYDANGQLVDMVTVDTNTDYEAVISTDAWASGSYKLVVTYGITTLQGYFDF